MLCSFSLFLGSQKNCSFLGSSVTSTGIASYSSLSMLKEPPVPYGEGKTRQAHSRAGRYSPSPPRTRPRVKYLSAVLETPTPTVHEKGCVLSYVASVSYQSILGFEKQGYNFQIKSKSPAIS